MWEDKSAVWQLLNKINNLTEDNEYLRSMINNLTDRVRRLETDARNNRYTDYFNYLQDQITEVRNSIPNVTNTTAITGTYTNVWPTPTVNVASCNSYWQSLSDIMWVSDINIAANNIRNIYQWDTLLYARSNNAGDAQSVQRQA